MTGVQTCALPIYHFSKKYITKDPTPIEIEMTTYEKEANTSMIDALNKNAKSGDSS